MHHCRKVQSCSCNVVVVVRAYTSVTSTVESFHHTQCMVQNNAEYKQITHLVLSNLERLEIGVSCSSVHTIFCCHYTMYQWRRKIPTAYIFTQVSLYHKKAIRGSINWLTLWHLSKLLGQVMWPCNSSHPFHRSTQCIQQLVASSAEAMTGNNTHHTPAWPSQR